MTGPDFAHTRAARDNRHRKALRLRLAMVTAGVTVEAGFALVDPDAGPHTAELRKRIRKLAGVDREPSRETWTAALVELERRPASIVDVDAHPGQAPCGCWPARDTGVLYEFCPRPGQPYGWPCPHGNAPPAPPTLCDRGGKGATAKDLEVVAEFGAELQRRSDEQVALEAAADVEAAGEPWWA